MLIHKLEKLGEKQNLGHKCILSLFNQLLSTNCKGRWFLTIKRPKSFKKKFLLHILFVERFSYRKKKKMELEKVFGFFMEGCHSFSLKRQFTFYSKKFRI
jgi:hypothetical protein